MQSKMIYRVPYEAAALTMHAKEVVICYKSEPLNGISYKFATEKETLDIYEFCMDLMEFLEKSEEFEDIETIFKKALEIRLGD